MEIVEYKLEDIDTLKYLVSELQDSLKEIEPQTIASGSKVKDSYTEDLLENVRAKNGQIYLMKDSERVLGFVAVYLNHDNDEDVEYLYVSDLIVVKSERGKGIGKLLLQKAEEYARNKKVEYVRIGSLVSNGGATQLYRKMGFDDYLITLQKKL
jgi:ribosomal protein S18 acetylase RimI-like enzyme